MTVRAGTDKRFHRAHLTPTRARRASARRRRIVRAALAMTLAGALGYQAREFLMAAPALHIDHLVIQGNHRLSDGEVRALVGDLEGQHILRVDLRAQQARLASSTWVRDATLRRVLPSTVEIVVIERRPVGLGRFGDRLYLVDERGTVIDEYGPSVADFDLPIIEGLSRTSAGDRRLADESRVRLAARVIREVAARPDLSQRLSQIDVADPYDAVVLLGGDPALLHLGDERFLERLESYLELAPALRARVPDIDYVDLRFDERVYVRPANAAGLSARAAHP